MTASEVLLRCLHLLLVLGVAVLVVRVGRILARRTRQPEVIGEIAAGLMVGPTLVGLFGSHTFHLLVPDGILSDLKLISEAGLILFMVGLVGKHPTGSNRPEGRPIGWVVAGSFLPAFGMGLLLAGWVVLTHDEVARGSAPLASFLLILAVSMSVTAVPVLARILADQGFAGTEIGRSALLSAIVIDAMAWLLIPVAVGLKSGKVGGFLQAVAVLAAGTLAAGALRLLLRTRFSIRTGARFPKVAALLVGALAITMALTMEHYGMTSIVGALMAGLAVPTGNKAVWQPVVETVTKAGQALVPVFFVVSGVTVLTKALGSASLTLIVLVTVLGLVGKGVGGYVGARKGGYSPFEALRIGTLMNTRGLTELIVLQVGYSAGVLSATLYLAFVVMSLVTTALTGPALMLVDRAEFRRRPVVANSLVTAGGFRE